MLIMIAAIVVIIVTTVTMVATIVVIIIITLTIIVIAVFMIVKTVVTVGKAVVMIVTIFVMIVTTVVIVVLIVVMIFRTVVDKSFEVTEGEVVEVTEETEVGQHRVRDLTAIPKYNAPQITVYIAHYYPSSGTDFTLHVVGVTSDSDQCRKNVAAAQGVFIGALGLYSEQRLLWFLLSSDSWLSGL